MSAAPLSLRAYARHRGCTLRSVQKAIRGRRLVASIVQVEGKPRIADPELADREWAANTDHTRSPGRAIDDLEELDDEDAPGGSLTSAAAREKHWKAELAELTYKQRAGELVLAAEMQAEITDTFSTVRSRLLGVPSKVKQAHPELPLAVLATIDDAIREALEELATAPPRLDEDDEDGDV